jgi:2-dehydro-3-deoxygluconokinase
MGLFRSTSLGSLATASDIRLGIGGAESNVAIGVARLGLEATWIGRVGDDSLGRRVIRELQAEGVQLSVRIDQDAPTGMMVKESPTPVTTRVSYYRAGSAGSRLSPEDIPPSTIQTGSVLHVTGITPALSDSSAEAIEAAVEIANSASIPVSFDVNHRSKLWGSRDPSSLYRDLVSRSTLIFAGIDEARIIVGDYATSVELAVAISQLGPSHVLIKEGSAGCTALIDGNSLRYPAFPIRPVDTVGAGDAFVAGYLAEYIDERDLMVRLETASRAGALACLGPGDWESFPRREDLALLDSRDPVAR